MDKKRFTKELEQVFRERCNEEKSLAPYIDRLIEKENLSPEGASRAMCILMSGKSSEERQKAFLTAMYKKTPSVDEIAAFAYTLRKLAEPVRLKIDISNNKPVLGDTCGTGGGTIETFNVSTTIMFILASSGIIIAKHGNRAITSKCGSADVLEALGVNINLSPHKVEECILEIKIGFIYAPNFHKAFKNVQKVRKELKFPTIFNILGPLANPAFSSEDRGISNVQVLGVNSPELVERMAEVLRLLNVKRAMVVYGFSADSNKGMDEVSTLGKTKVSELKEDGSIDNYFLDIEEFGFKRALPEDLSGGTPSENAKILIDILKGKEKGPKRDLVLLNASCGLYVGGKVDTIKAGIDLAQKQIDEERAYKKLEELREFSVRK